MLDTGAGVLERYADVLTPKALDVIAGLVALDRERKDLMQARLERRRRRAQNAERIQFLDPESTIPRTQIKVGDARAGRFTGSAIPADLQCQWIQGTGPGAKPRSPIENSIRNVAYALLSGADGWMFDGEDALGQIETMSLDNQRNLRLAFARDPIFL
ncbi:MAG: malate synthase, partial [Chloroflexota bacterium]|nr:malate synthase [Chloroflexota bacterium]